MWKVDKDNTKEHWLELSDEDGSYHASVKWDGCIHFDRYENIPATIDPERKGPGCCDSYIHICNVDDMIARLQALKQEALLHFGDGWPR